MFSFNEHIIIRIITTLTLIALEDTLDLFGGQIVDYDLVTIDRHKNEPTITNVTCN